MRKRIRARPLRKDYRVILVDPPWKYTSGIGVQGAAEKHYPTMSLQELLDMRRFIDSIAAKDCALFMWSTWPTLTDALPLIAGWGFKYKTLAFNWIKVNRNNLQPFMGLGRYTRANCEPCLVATRGKPARKSAYVGQTIFDYKRKHSQKPLEQYERIKELYDGPYIELFCRGSGAPGWDVWGLEAINK